MQYHPQLANVATTGPSSSPAGFIPMSVLAYMMHPGALFGGLMPSPGPHCSPLINCAITNAITT